MPTTFVRPAAAVTAVSRPVAHLIVALIGRVGAGKRRVNFLRLRDGTPRPACRRSPSSCSRGPFAQRCTAHDRPCSPLALSACSCCPRRGSLRLSAIFACRPARPATSNALLSPNANCFLIAHRFADTIVTRPRATFLPFMAAPLPAPARPAPTPYSPLGAPVPGRHNTALTLYMMNSKPLQTYSGYHAKHTLSPGEVSCCCGLRKRRLPRGQDRPPQAGPPRRRKSTRARPQGHLS